MLKKILIANRGAIAVRIIRTLRKMGITAVAVYSEADKASLHVRMADEAYSLGSGSITETYLNQEKLFAIIESANIEAIHPGYGFLSENAEFCRSCENRGIVFLGPAPQHMIDFGMKHTARALADKAAVPLLPGTDLLDDIDQAITAANGIKYPVMLKSTAGGGGIGMQLCHDEDELIAAFDSVKRLGQNNFGNASVFIEKYVAQARHIEVQVFGDGKGKAIALGERDCSAQRRHQKVIEETPAPGIPDPVRKKLYQSAVTLLSSVNYRSAGTVEFIYNPQEQAFYFLEVNTRLQVEHGVTEEVFALDLVEWMVNLGAGTLADLDVLSAGLSPVGHAIQVRLYAEDPYKNFQPCAGLLTQVEFPESKNLRIDHWIEAGIEVSPNYDPMLAKVIIHAGDRDTAIENLLTALAETSLYGIETNKDYVTQVLQTNVFRSGQITTRYLNDFTYSPARIDVLQPGAMTSIQDYPGRSGYWSIGVPPSGPFDNYSFQLGNRLLDNDPAAAGLEMTISGPSLTFSRDALIAITGAGMDARIDDTPVKCWQVARIKAGQTLHCGKVKGAGSRSYLLVKGGIQCPEYLGSRSTFTLGQFGGHSGRALRTGDVLHLHEGVSITDESSSIPCELLPPLSNDWQLRVIYGPHGAPDFFTDDDIQRFFTSAWEVHYNSSRTGIRLIGPKPEWARSDGGEAGMHPSNIHDNAYAFGTVDFTGDMPVILGPDGPSLGGFVCPATVISADLWKLGQLKAGDKIRFLPVTLEQATAIENRQNKAIIDLKTHDDIDVTKPATLPSPVLDRFPQQSFDVIYRACGDKFLLVEYGDMKLDLTLRFRVHALMLYLQEQSYTGILELTPGIRSLQIHYDNHTLAVSDLIDLLKKAEKELGNGEDLEIPARIVHLPLSWNDEACQKAVDKYMQSVRKDAPWCPDNIEFIRRINGLDSVDTVKEIVFSASYLVMGLGDVYLGAPVATPLDPRHRLVTTKYNPARTWTAENSVGIGGAYLCIYGMEGPGGYQFVGRTLQMWNRHRKTAFFDKPWLLRFFDQIRFYEVSADELTTIRQQFPVGEYPIEIEHTQFSITEYKKFLETHKADIADFSEKRQQAFDSELQRWIETGQINYQSEEEQPDTMTELDINEDLTVVDAHVAGNVWQLCVKKGDAVKAGDTVMILESMKMEIDIPSPVDGTVSELYKAEGTQVAAGHPLVSIEATGSKREDS